MTASISPESGETVTLEVSGGKISLLRTLLENENLDDSLKRVKIELEWKGDTDADGPPMPDESGEGDTTPESKAKRIEEGLNPGGEESGESGRESAQKEADNGVTSNEPNISYPDNPSLSDLPAVSLKPDTSKWSVVTVLYLTDGFTKAKGIEKRLKGTDKEYAYASLASALTNLVESGVVCYRKSDDRYGKREYQLTQFGRDLAEAVENQRDDAELTLKSAPN